MKESVPCQYRLYFFAQKLFKKVLDSVVLW